MVPLEAREQTGAVLGSPVTRALRVWGGYGPTPTFRLTLADGRRAFLKGTNRDTNEFATAALDYEARVYRDLGAFLMDWAPAMLGSVRWRDWHLLLLADAGPRAVPPWTPRLTRAITHALAAFHTATLGANLPPWLTRAPELLAHENWERTAQNARGFRDIADLAGDAAADALLWFREIAPTVSQTMRRPDLLAGPYALLHGDLRSDNLRYTQRRLTLFDWPAIAVGRPEWDIVAFAQSVTVEGGPAPEAVMALYAERFPVREAAVDVALAWCVTFMAERAWRPEIPGLPRLRRFQRQQLGTLLAWAMRRWSLPSAPWLDRLLT
jgi:hypothetical protein